MKKEIIVIGSGIAGLTAAAVLAKKGSKVTVFEKNSETGGRAGKFEAGGFLFDKGPSWYWMPDVFEKFFLQFNKKVSDFYELKLLSPSFSVFFDDEVLEIPSSFQELESLFDSLEKDGAEKLRKFLKEAEIKYKIGIQQFAYNPSYSIFDFINVRSVSSLFHLDILTSFHKHIRKYFLSPKLISLLEFPILFLGALPKNTPALYSLMNYAELKLGTWYPMGGFSKVLEGFAANAQEHEVKIVTSSPVEKIVVEKDVVKGIMSKGLFVKADAIIAAADYHHVEQKLLIKEYRNYSPEYWSKRKMAPSCLIFYVGVNKKVRNLQHHNLFFDSEFKKHAEEIYDRQVWPENPCFYVCSPSKTDTSVAPPGSENLFLLMPVPSGLEDDPLLHWKYFEQLISRIEKATGSSIRSNIVFKKSYCINNFIEDFNAFKGNAYGLANTLRQTAILKPSMKSKKVANLWFAGQLTVPGPGLPPSVISGQIAGNELIKKLRL